MRRRLTLHFAAMMVLASACAAARGPTARPTRDTTQPATAAAAATRDAAPVALRVRSSNYLFRFEHVITVDDDGVLRSEQTDNKSWGRGDIDPKHQLVERRRGTLTAAQRAELARLLDAKRFEPKYPERADEQHLTVTYHGQTTDGGQWQMPQELQELYARLTEWSRAMPLVTPATTKAAIDDQREEPTGVTR